MLWGYVIHMNICCRISKLQSSTSAIDLADVPAKSRAATQEKQIRPSKPLEQKEIDAILKRYAELETLIHENTPLDGLHDLGAFSNHLKGLIFQKNASVDEIKRLSMANEGNSKHSTRRLE